MKLGQKWTKDFGEPLVQKWEVFTRAPACCGAQFWCLSVTLQLSGLCPNWTKFQMLNKILEMNKLMYEYLTIVIVPLTGNQNDVFSHFHVFLPTGWPDWYDSESRWGQDFHDVWMRSLWVFLIRCCCGSAWPVFQHTPWKSPQQKTKSVKVNKQAIYREKEREQERVRERKPMR